MRIVSITAGLDLGIWSEEWIDALRTLGDFTLVEDRPDLSDADVAEMYRAADVAIVGWAERRIPDSLAADPGLLRYICSYSGTIRHTVPRSIVEADDIVVSNWGDLPATSVAEAAMTLLLASAHQLPVARRAQHEGAWGFDGTLSAGLDDLAVGVYGCGVIGRRFVEMVRPFGARVRVFDPYVPVLPEGVERADTLDDLCGWSEALVIHAGASAETERSVGAAQLSLLPDHAIVVNTARGSIVDQDAILVELIAGRLRAALDVLEPDSLAADHPMRQLDNVILTFHQAPNAKWPIRSGLQPAQRRVVEQLERFARGETPFWTFDLDRYDRST
jgi:phosphoglycerate dehydrogenase-like enzyme